MLSIDTLFITGLPSNKPELIDGRVHCCMPFRERQEAEEIFERSEWETPAVLVVGKRPKEDDPGFSVPDEPIALEHLLLAGHPLRRYEILEDVAPCVLAFRDPLKARRNFEHWASEAARLEGVPCPVKVGESFEGGRFRLWRDQNRVHLDIRYSGQLQLQLLELFSRRDVWETEPAEEIEVSPASRRTKREKGS